MDISQSPNLPEPEAVHAIVVYDPKTGAIVHRHLTVRYPGGRVAAFSEEVECRVDVKRQRLLPGRRKPLTHADLVRRSRRTSK
jgi:hypothetical protein